MNTPRHSPGQPYNANCIPSHGANVARMNEEKKNPHAVALGSMSSPEKAKAAQQNGKEGGRPTGS